VKILHTVEFYHPSVGGMQEVVKQLSERMIRLGHEVTVATTRLPERAEKAVNGVRIAEFEISGNLVRGFRGDVESYRRFLLESDFDVITNFAAQQWATDVALPLLDDIGAAKVFVPTGFSGLYLPRYGNYFSSMRSWLHKYDMNVFLSDDYRDINFARDCGVKNIMVIPNGASEDEFLPEAKCDVRALLGIPHDNFLILHIGSHTSLKGHAEAIRIFAKARIRNATLLIAANEIPGGCARSCNIKRVVFNSWPGRRTDGKKVLIASLPRPETIAAYKTADLFLFPSNIECSPLVLFECMASRTPFFTTDVGNAMEIIRWSGGGMLLPTRKDAKGNSHANVTKSAEMLAAIYGDPAGRERMAKKGFTAWQERFTWGKIARAYEGLYLSLIQGGR
jgi:glycosyltransferase involved in cell wall biosynthesis